jgi:hypothetical protein
VYCVKSITQYTPRGHYAKNEQLQGYFRAAMWLSRLEFNLVSRSSRSSALGRLDPSETPREALDALALVDLAARSGAQAKIDLVDKAWELLAGRREDVSFAQLAELRERAKITSLKDPKAYEALKAAIGDGFQRTTRVHPMAEGATVLPAIATMIGPRIVPDASAVMPLVNGAVPDRQTVGAADLAYALGDDHARRYLAKDLAEFPKLAGQLDVSRKIVRDAHLSDDLYSAWLKAVRGLAIAPEGAVPSFATTEPFQDLRLNTITAAYGQLKHNYVLMAGQPYAEFGCEIPDGYVEPAPAAYEALIEYADRGARVATLLDPKDSMHARRHFERVGQILRVLRAIVDDELRNRPLSDEEKRWLGMVAELSLNLGVDTTGHPPMYTGWYFDFFFAREGDGMRGADFIADYFTGEREISYVGAGAPRLGIFVVDVGGPPRAFVGPVASAFEVRGPIASRYGDDQVATIPGTRAPWAASYTIAAAPDPSYLQLHFDADSGDITVESDRDLGATTVRILDHHRLPIASKTLKVGVGPTTFPFHKKRGIEGVTVQVGDWRAYAPAGAYGEIEGLWGKAPEQSH